MIVNLENQYQIYDYKHDIKYIHVLGNGHNDDDTQPISSKLSDVGLKRVLEGIIIHNRTKGSKLIFTGYEGNAKVSTAKMNANLAMALGVKEENIILGEKARDTQEEAYFAKDIVGNKVFVLVTSASHMPRSMMLFNNLGLNSIAAPTAYFKQDARSFLSLPTPASFIHSQIAIHEYLGILWAKIRS